jgi:GxxExxY protein
MDINEITGKIIGAAITVHSKMGPGLRENIYEKCLAIELTRRGLTFECQAPTPAFYDGIKISHDLFVDVLVEHQVVVEVKAVDRFDPIHTAQLTSYLRLTNCTVGLLINFNVLLLPRGIRRIVLGYDDPNPRIPRIPRP